MGKHNGTEADNADRKKDSSSLWNWIFSRAVDVNQEEASLSVKTRVIRGVNSLLVPMIPIFILVSVLVVTDTLHDLALRSDLLFLACGLYAEGSSRARYLDREDNDILSTVGFLGTIFSAVLASMVVLHELHHISDTSVIFTKDAFKTFQLYLVSGVVFYYVLIKFFELGQEKAKI